MASGPRCEGESSAQASSLQTEVGQDLTEEGAEERGKRNRVFTSRGRGVVEEEPKRRVRS